MKEQFINRPKVSIDPDEYIRLLGYPSGHELQDRAKELADETIKWYDEHGKPWIYFRKANCFELTNDEFSIDAMSFQSKAVVNRFHKGAVEDVYLVAVSAGKECEEQANKLWKESKPDEYFFMEMYGSAVVENLIMQTSSALCSWADKNDLSVLPHYSPGYSQWDVSDQLKLIDLVKSEANAGQLEIITLDSGMLKPKKSLLAIIGVTQEKSNLSAQPGMIPCEKCALKGCQYRRKAYRLNKAKPQQSRVNKKLSISDNEVIMEKKVNYSLKEKVLNKWVEERLTLEHLTNGDIEAKFTYEGTTCSSIGFPLKFEHSVTLFPEGSDFRIKEIDCSPAKSDIGHTKMCQYIKQGNELLNIIREDKEWVGRSLLEIINEKTEFFPSGCYCDKEGRRYKWHQISQVIHYALTGRNKEIGTSEKVA